MNNELKLFKKSADTLIEQTKTRPQEALEFKLNKQMETFSFSTSISISEEGKGLLAVTLVLKESFLSLISVKKTIVFQLAYQVVGEVLLI